MGAGWLAAGYCVLAGILWRGVGRIEKMKRVDEEGREGERAKKRRTLTFLCLPSSFLSVVVFLHGAFLWFSVAGWMSFWSSFLSSRSLLCSHSPCRVFALAELIPHHPQPKPATMVHTNSFTEERMSLQESKGMKKSCGERDEGSRHWSG